MYIRLVFDKNVYVYIFLCWFVCFVNTTSWWITVNTFGLFLSALHQELHRHFPRSRSPVPTSQELWSKDVSFIVCISRFQTSKRDSLFLVFLAPRNVNQSEKTFWRAEDIWSASGISSKKSFLIVLVVCLPCLCHWFQRTCVDLESRI